MRSLHSERRERALPTAAGSPVSAHEPRSFAALFFEQVRRSGGRTALRHKTLGIWSRVSWDGYGEAVRRVAAALLEFGIRRGERVAILGENRPEWLYCHLGIMAAGAATCGVYATAAPGQISYVLRHSGARLLFVDGREHVAKALEALKDTAVERVVVWDELGRRAVTDPRIVHFEAFLDAGDRFRRSSRGVVEDRVVSAITSDDIAMVIYTSGTSGPPKGAMLSHGNLLAQSSTADGDGGARRHDEALSYLPLAHVYENMVSLFQAVRAGYTVNFVESPETLFDNMREVSPTYLAGVPRFWEKLASRIELAMAESTPLKRWLYHQSKEIGRRCVRLRAGGGGPGPLLSLAYGLACALVLHPLRRQFGLERTRVARCGGAPASPELFDYFQALGVRLINGYGMTEATGTISMSRPERHRVGTAGEPLPGTEVRIADDGEILVRGPTVFQGYLEDPDLTAEAIDGEGWLHTGDLGTFEGGALRVVDRKKDIFITAGGKNVSPAFIENKLKFSPYVQDAVVIGDRRRYVVALLLVEEESVTRFAEERRVSFSNFAELTRAPEVVRLLQQEVDRVNESLSQAETIKKFALLPRPFFVEDGDVTSTMKVKRRAVEQRYAGLIQALYGD